MPQIPIEDAVDFLIEEGYDISDYPHGIILEIPEEFSPEELYELFQNSIAEEDAKEIPTGKNIIITRFDGEGIDITIPVKYVAPMFLLNKNLLLISSDGNLTLSSLDDNGVRMLGLEKTIKMKPAEHYFSYRVFFRIAPEFITQKDLSKILKSLLYSDEQMRMVGEWELQDVNSLLTIYIGEDEYTGYIEALYGYHMPKLSFPIHAEIPPEDFKRAINGLSKINSISGEKNIDMMADKARYLEISVAPKDERINAKVYFPDAVTKLSSNVSVEKSSYNMAMLKGILPLLKKTKEPIEINLRTDYPLDLRYIHEGERYRFILAPRVEY